MATKTLYSTAVMTLTLGACAALAQVQHGILEVVEIDGGNTPASVSLTRVGGYGVWQPVSSDPNFPNDSSSRADYVVDFGTGNDQNLGIMITGPYDDFRVEPSVPAGYYATTSQFRSGAGSNHYYVGIFNAPTGGEVNYNATLAYFPIADGWSTGGFYNSANGGVITLFVGSPEIVLSNPFDPNLPSYPNVLVDNADGYFGLRLANVDMNRDGVLLACGGKNEDNMAWANVNWDGTGVIVINDNGDGDGGGEQDPGAFVFIPEGTAGVTMGRVTASARTLFKQGDFDIVMVGQPSTDGTFRLTIPGEGPTTGTLLVSPYNELTGTTVDNPVFCVPDGDGWLITTRDIASMVLQDLDANDVFLHFAFFKNDVAITPGTPSKSYLSRMADIVAARFTVVEYAPTNTNGDMRADKSLGSTALGVFGDNRGDVGISWLGSRPASYVNNSLDSYEGVWLGNCTEFLRDNSASGGVSGWGVFAFDNGVARTEAVSDVGGELNINFALAFFPAVYGFQQNADVQILTGTQDIVTITGDAVQDGVCLAVNWDNNNRIVSATPSADTYLIQCWEGVSGEPSADWDYGYVYIPYDTPGIVAGQVAEDGTIISGTGNFTVALGSDGALGIPVALLSIPGVNAATDGVLLVTPTAGPQAMSWEVGPGGTFEVAGLDAATFTPGLAAFAFAYVPYDLAPAEDEPCFGDLNCDGEIGFGDINPFVLYLSNYAVWETTFPGCDPKNGDVNDDGAYPSFGDINAFVALIGNSQGPCN